ncbi:GGDEF domain-containing protein [Marinobacterium lutimaris]|uniref:diguanylate cyclase n=1 Tax=Marinobacterium lutimaris TaxID=568106 RepID=A0A1H6C165_9GAMM|nr:diguanylate cyclase [Marinobacterium lutimaris]SEG66395.1 diguanylate cyclase (GGDEF) domain-containing protein [Marinobacterium lutimaris]
MLIRLLLFPLLFLSAWVAADTVKLDSGWSYRWGDSPFDSNGVPLWTQEPELQNWHAIHFPADPPDRADKENIWFRVQLPEGNWRDPVLYISSVDLIVEAYVDGRTIYSYGHFDEQGRGTFEGWPWHMMELPADSLGKPLYLRIFSDYKNIGLWGEIKITERSELISSVINESLEGIIVGVFSLVIALLAVILACMQTERRMFISVALYSLSAAGMVIPGSPVSQVLLNAPLLWDYVGALGYFLMPVAMALLMETWFKDRSVRLYRVVRWVSVAYIVLAIGGSLAGIIELSNTYPAFDFLFAVSLVLLFLPALRGLSGFSRQQWAVLASYGLFAALLLVDMGVAHKFLPWVKVPIPWGSLAFSVVVVLIAVIHFNQTQRELKSLNESLDRQVKERTAELELLSYEDPLTKLKNRRFFDESFMREASRSKRQGCPLSLLICDIDQFKHFNDTQGHAAGDEALRQVGIKMKQAFRQSDLACRYGGEEFVVLMPGASSMDAVARAEELRRAVAENDITLDGRALPRITLSVGVASWPGSVSRVDNLFAKADEALYKAKREGRDRVIEAAYEAG